MTALRSEIRPGAYADSIVLMRLQRSLAELPGILDAGVTMGTAANLEILAASGLLPPEVAEAGADDLVLVVRGDSDRAAAEALASVDRLLARRGEEAEGDDYRPRSLATAARMLPDARWVAISVPGRHAARVARQALELGRNVFLYSDNVALEEEIELKKRAQEAGLLVMGPDCGTASVGGVGLGFANRVRRGEVGLVAASGTGLQAVTSRLHQLGAGVSHALGTGGRDLDGAVGAATAGQSLRLLAGDPATRSIVLLSKPPAPEVTARLLAIARGCGKPVVVYFQGDPPPLARCGNLRFATGLEEAADLALEAVSAPGEAAGESPAGGGSGPLRGLFAGGTLAYEDQQGLRVFLAPLYSNAPIRGVEPLPDSTHSLGHAILDLGADEYTVGRLHPMIDPELRLRRLRQEAADPETGLVLLDVVLGEGSHPDPAAELAPAIAEVKAERPGLEVVVLIVGTDEDPQDLAAQTARLGEAGARVTESPRQAIEWVVRRLAPTAPAPAVDLDALSAPVAVINVGLESFYESLVDQEVPAVQVDWRPPAGGDARLLEILDKMNPEKVTS